MNSRGKKFLSKSPIVLWRTVVEQYCSRRCSLRSMCCCACVGSTSTTSFPWQTASTSTSSSRTSDGICVLDSEGPCYFIRVVVPELWSLSSIALRDTSFCLCSNPIRANVPGRNADGVVYSILGPGRRKLIRIVQIRYYSSEIRRTQIHYSKAYVSKTST